MNVSLAELKHDVEQITSCNDIHAFKAAIAASQQWLARSFEQGEDVTRLVHDRAFFVDHLLCHAWQLLALDDCADVSLIAVGGYGRGHLHPASDLDLLILSQQALPTAVAERIGQFITFLWDTGLEVGQAVRTLDQCVSLGQEDITVATNLLECRFLCGKQALFEQLQSRLHAPDFWSSRAFFLAKRKEQRERHNKFNDTSYNLEPNIKENPGCIRDLQMVGWVARKHFQVDQDAHLVDSGYLTQEELNELFDCRQELWRFRFALHLETGRSENRLLFDYQPAVARRLGYGDEGKISVERMMKSLFRTIQRVSELNHMLLQHFYQDIVGVKVKVRRELTPDFSLEDGLLVPRHQGIFDAPVKILQCFLLIADTPEVKNLHSATLRLLRRARRQLDGQYLSDQSECRACFMQLIRHPSFFQRAWDLMHQHGILRAYLKQWDHIVGMMQFDLFHAYTVDEHTHRVVKNIQHYFSAQGKSDFPRCHRIVHNLDKPWLLFLAAIFHDIAKGRKGDHSVLGSQMVRDFAQAHELSDKDTGIICWLVENHLAMSMVAQRRDIYDPEVIGEFATLVRTKSKLNHLYALTLADIRATNSNLWNDWKASLLQDLYLLTRKAMEEGLESEVDLNDRIQSHRNEARDKLLADGFDEGQIEQLWQQMDNDYFVRFSPRQIIWHTSSILSAAERDDPLTVAFSNTTSRAGTELLIYTKDRPSLFAQVASVLDSRHCSIHDANLISTSSGYVLDTFILLEKNGDRITTAGRRNTLRQALMQQLQQHELTHKNKRKLSRRMKQLRFATKIRFFTTANELTLMELEALDAPGLLATIGKQLVEMDLSLHKAKIATIGERAEDVFILSTQHGQGLSQEQQVQLKRRLIATLDNQSET